MKKAFEMVACPKCGGTGYIPHYAGIANGVCFTCAGVGKVKATKLGHKVVPLTPYQSAEIETIKTGELSGLGYKRLLVLRSFAHWRTPHCLDLLTTWHERGEGHFQEAQEAMLALHRTV